MVVAMASAGINCGLYMSKLKATEKQLKFGGGPLLCSFGLDPVQLSCVASNRRLWSAITTFTPKASPAVQDGSSQDTNVIPTPVVIIDQDSDPDATVVEVTFGDRLGALLDIMNALKNLELNAVKGNMYLDSSGKHNKFAITKVSSGRKVDEPELLEAIRLTIINNLLKYHPESSAQLAMGAAFGVTPPSEKLALRRNG